VKNKETTGPIFDCLSVFCFSKSTAIGISGDGLPVLRTAWWANADETLSSTRRESLKNFY
jgi:hypothetical protein